MLARLVQSAITKPENQSIKFVDHTQLNAHKNGLPPTLIARLLGLDEVQVIALLRTLLPGADG